MDNSDKMDELRLANRTASRLVDELQRAKRSALTLIGRSPTPELRHYAQLVLSGITASAAALVAFELAGSRSIREIGARAIRGIGQENNDDAE